MVAYWCVVLLVFILGAYNLSLGSTGDLLLWQRGNGYSLVAYNGQELIYLGVLLVLLGFLFFVPWRLRGKMQ